MGYRDVFKIMDADTWSDYIYISSTDHFIYQYVYLHFCMYVLAVVTFRWSFSSPWCNSGKTGVWFWHINGGESLNSKVKKQGGTLNSIIVLVFSPKKDGQFDYRFFSTWKNLVRLKKRDLLAGRLRGEVRISGGWNSYSMEGQLPGSQVTVGCLVGS